VHDRGPRGQLQIVVRQHARWKGGHDSHSIRRPLTKRTQGEPADDEEAYQAGAQTALPHPNADGHKCGDDGDGQYDWPTAFRDQR
jgi:hypothetical protein